MNSIKMYYHPVFSTSLWNPARLRISNTVNEILEEMMTKIGGRNKINLEPIRLMMVMMDTTNSPLDKALAVWNSYYRELPAYDFQNEDAPRWMLISLRNEHVQFLSSHIKVQEVVMKIFDVNNLQFDPWKKPYLPAFKFWKERDQAVNAMDWIIKAGSDILKHT